MRLWFTMIKSTNKIPDTTNTNSELFARDETLSCEKELKISKNYIEKTGLNNSTIFQTNHQMCANAIPWEYFFPAFERFLNQVSTKMTPFKFYWFSPMFPVENHQSALIARFSSCCQPVLAWFKGDHSRHHKMHGNDSRYTPPGPLQALGGGFIMLEN